MLQTVTILAQIVVGILLIKDWCNRKNDGGFLLGLGIATAIVIQFVYVMSILTAGSYGLRSITIIIGAIGYFIASGLLPYHYSWCANRQKIEGLKDPSERDEYRRAMHGPFWWFEVPLNLDQLARASEDTQAAPEEEAAIRQPLLKEWQRIRSLIEAMFLERHIDEGEKKQLLRMMHVPFLSSWRRAEDTLFELYEQHFSAGER